MKKNRTFMYHAELSSGKRGTFAGELTPSGTLSIATAICNPKDTFTRKRGRIIALGRMIKNKVTTVNIQEPDKFRTSGFVNLIHNSFDS